MKIEYHGDMDFNKFMFQLFGLFGRELGTNKKPHRFFTDNPNDLLTFVEECKNENRPCWISAQPMKAYNEVMGIEKLYFDFDYDAMLKKKKNVSKETIKKLREQVENEVKDFLSHLDFVPLIVRTYKGYHVYIFLRRIYTFEKKDFDFAKKVYTELQMYLIRGIYECLDEHPIGDLKRLARVPLSIHEKGGICFIVDKNLKKDKVRNLDIYRTYGIPESIIEMAVKSVNEKIKKTHALEEKLIQEAGERMVENNNENFVGTIRPCFQKRMDEGEMCHGQRLALLVEAYNSGYLTEDMLVNLFHCFKDFKEETTRYQVKWFFDHHPNRYPPYRCSTIMNKGWCLENDCPYYNKILIRRKNNN